MKQEGRGGKERKEEREKAKKIEEQRRNLTEER